MTWWFVWAGAIAAVYLALRVLNQPFSRSSLVHLCSAIADSFDTTYEWEHGRLQFQYQYQDATVIVSFRRVEWTSRYFFLEVRIRGRQPSLRCEVYPDGGRRSESQGRSLLGMQDTEIGDRAFDDKYVVKTEDISLTKDLLSDHVRNIIDEMHNSADIRDVYVALDHLQLTASKRMVPPSGTHESDRSNRQQALGFIAMAVRLYDRMVEASSTLPAAIEFLGAVTADTETECQVCGEPLRNRLVRCRTCKTLHHKDCWEYYGACSTYGCKQKRFTMVKRTEAGDSTTPEAPAQPPVRVPAPEPKPQQRERREEQRRGEREEQQPRRPPHQRELEGSRPEQVREAQRRRHRRRRQRARRQRHERQQTHEGGSARALGRVVGRSLRRVGGKTVVAILCLGVATAVYYSLLKVGRGDAARSAASNRSEREPTIPFPKIPNTSSDPSSDRQSDSNGNSTEKTPDPPPPTRQLTSQAHVHMGAHPRLGIDRLDQSLALAAADNDETTTWVSKRWPSQQVSPQYQYTFLELVWPNPVEVARIMIQQRHDRLIFFTLEAKSLTTGKWYPLAGLQGDRHHSFANGDPDPKWLKINSQPFAEEKQKQREFGAEPDNGELLTFDFTLPFPRRVQQMRLRVRNAAAPVEIAEIKVFGN